MAQAGKGAEEVKPVLVDTGFLVAVYDKRETYHARCRRLYEDLVHPLATCEAVIAEAVHLLSNSPDAAHGILSSIENGSLRIPFTLRETAGAVRSILAKYSDLRADLADACLIHMADELDTGDILTLDSDFKHYRWRRNRSFRLLIPLD